jgi:nitroreductase
MPEPPALTVSEAVAARYSCRAFLPTPVDPRLVREILERARRAPSGGNLQPWRVDVLTGGALTRFLAEIGRRREASPRGEGVEYDVYPRPVPDPWERRRFAVGEDLYASIGVKREDRAGRLKQFFRNYEFFGAPVAMFVSIDRRLGPPQWSDVGMFMQTLMLLAAERGLATCAQEAWAVWPRAVARFLGWPPEQMLFSGLALGFADESAAVNRWRSQRAPLAETVVFHA